MKKIYLLTVILAFASSTFAQSIIVREANKSVAPKLILNSNTSKDITDTLFLDDYVNNVTNNYNLIASDYGYILGTNWDSSNVAGNTQIAQGYTNGSAIHIEQVLVYIGAVGKYSANGSSLNVQLHLLDDSSHYGSGQNQFDIICPGTLLGSTTIPWNDIDTSVMFSVATFNTPVPINGQDFAVVLDVSNFYTNSDTVSIIGGETVASTVYGLEYTWYLYPAATPFWTQFSHVWISGGSPMDIAIAAFPVYGDGVGINDPDFYQGMKLSIYPNPVSNVASIDYALQYNSKVSIDIINVAGKVIKTVDLGSKNIGKYNTTINVEDLASGNYFISLNANGSRFIKKLIVK